MKISYLHNALKHIGLMCWVRIVEHPFVSVAGSSGLVCVYSWYKKQSVLYFFLELCKSCNIVQNACLLISGAWPYYKKEPVILTSYDISDLFISVRFYLSDFFCYRELFYNFGRFR